MTTVHSYKEVKASKPSIQVAVAFMLLLPIVGMIFFPIFTVYISQYYTGKKSSN